MIRQALTFTIAFAACALMVAPSIQAQCSGCSGGHRLGSRHGGILGARNVAAGYDQDGMLLPTSNLVGPKATLKAASHDFFSPHRVYSYSNGGLKAAHTHTWNGNQQNVYAWHGGHQNWRWGSPTALVVPPTSGYQSTYAWGVGQTRSTPIHHQFGRGGAASIGGGGGGGFQNTPYWPSSTDQFGIYPVRGPW